MSPLSWLRLALMCARRRFSRSGFSLLRSSAGSLALRGSPMLGGKVAALQGPPVGDLCPAGHRAETQAGRVVCCGALAVASGVRATPEARL